MAKRAHIMWDMSNSPGRLGDARATWAHEDSKKKRDKRLALARVREVHDWVDPGNALAEELEKTKGVEAEIDDDTLIVPLSHWKNKQIAHEQDEAHKHRKAHVKMMQEYRKNDIECKEMEGIRSDLHEKQSELEFESAEFQRRRLNFKAKIVDVIKNEKMIQEEIDLLKEEYQEECLRTGIAKMEADFLIQVREERFQAREERHCCVACCTFLCWNQPSIRDECRNCKCAGRRCCDNNWLTNNLDPSLVLMDWMRVREEEFGHGASYLSPKMNARSIRGGGGGGIGEKRGIVVQTGHDKR